MMVMRLGILRVGRDKPKLIKLLDHRMTTHKAHQSPPDVAKQLIRNGHSSDHEDSQIFAGRVTA